MYRTKLSTKGFTIIEVMIVLVIAAVILLIVFLAVPALQRNSRNNARKADVSRLAAAWQEFTVNNNGVPPNSTNAQIQQLTDLARVTTFEEVVIRFNNLAHGGGGNSLTNNAYILVGNDYRGAKCNAAGTNAAGNAETTGSDPNPGQIAIVYYLEPGRTRQCIDS